MKNTALLIALLLFGLIGISTACSKPGAANNPLVTSSLSFPEKGNFRLSLTDAPHPSLTSVFVNIDHVELLLEKDGKQGRLILGQDMGTLDLLKLRDGVHLPIRDLNLKENVVVKQFRLILKEEGHWLVRKDESTCYLKTPSQQKTGLKLIIPGGGVSIEGDSMYSLIVDFDVDHSIVDNQSNCLLKPVLKVKSLVKVPKDSDDSDESSETNEGETGDDGTDSAESSDGTDSSQNSSDGGEPSSGDSSSSTGGETSTGGTTGGTVDDGGSASSGDGSSTDQPVEGDGAPPVTDGDPTYFQ